MKSLYQELKEQYEVYGSGVKPLKGDRNRWIDGKITGKIWFVRGALERFYVFGKECCLCNPAGNTEKTGGRQSSSSFCFFG